MAERIETAQGEGFLRALKSEWEAHNKSVQMIRDILMYMDRIYVKQHVSASAAAAACSCAPVCVCVCALVLLGRGGGAAIRGGVVGHSAALVCGGL